MKSIGDITYTRGDTEPISIRLKNKATKEYIDLTGFSFRLTVDPEKEPVDSSNSIFQLIGIVDPDQVANKGLVTFYPTEADTDHVGRFYYDIERIDPSGHKKTFALGLKFILKQDITK